MFTFDHDLSRRFLRVEISGFWTPEVLARFQDEATAVLQRALAAGATPGEGHILVIASDFPVQDKGLTDEISQFIPLYGRLAKRIAVVGSASALQRLQVKRMVGGNAAVFLDEDEARTWLFAG